MIASLFLGGAVLAACSNGTTTSGPPRAPGTSTTGAAASTTTVAVSRSTAASSTTEPSLSQCPAKDLVGIDRGQLGRRGHHRSHPLAAEHGFECLHPRRIPRAGSARTGWCRAPDDGDPKGRLQLHRHGAGGRAAHHRSVGRVQPRVLRRPGRHRDELPDGDRARGDTPRQRRPSDDRRLPGTVRAGHARRLTGVRRRPVHDRIDRAVFLSASGTAEKPYFDGETRILPRTEASRIDASAAWRWSRSTSCSTTASS